MFETEEELVYLGNQHNRKSLKTMKSEDNIQTDNQCYSDIEYGIKQNILKDRLATFMLR